MFKALNMLTSLERFANAFTWERGHPCPLGVREHATLFALAALMRAKMTALPGNTYLVNSNEFRSSFVRSEI